MSNNPRVTVARIIAAIEGSNGIKSVICAAASCSYKTLNKYIGNSKRVRVAFDDECNKMIGLAHSVVANNIRASAKQQEGNDTAQADSADAKWYLARKGKDHGFGTEPVAPVVAIDLTLNTWRKQAADRRKQVEDL